MEVLEKKRAVFIDPARMKLAEYIRQDWVANVPEGVEIEDIVKPEFWSHMAAYMKPYDRLEVRQEDGSWIAELVVLMTDRTWAKVQVLNKYDLQAESVAGQAEKKHEVQWKGPHLKWCVVRLVDKSVLKDGMDKNEAFRWMTEHEKIVG